jgi:hypothetical protein
VTELLNGGIIVGVFTFHHILKKTSSHTFQMMFSLVGISDP